MYMDDIKQFAKNENELEAGRRLIHATRKNTGNISPEKASTEQK